MFYLTQAQSNIEMEFLELMQEVTTCKKCTKHSDCTYTCCDFHSKMACESFVDLSKTTSVSQLI